MFAGMVPPGEVVRYYQAGDAFVCASQSETQGLTYFEALACGLPAIVPRDLCLEGVVENGVNGWQWKDAAGFHQALEVLLSGTRNDSLRAGALATAERYSAGHFAAQAMQVYSEAIERRRTLNGGLPAGVPAALSGACFFLCLWLGVWAWQKGLLTDLGALQAWVAGLGVWAAVAFVAFQAIQVVIPILPAGWDAWRVWCCSARGTALPTTIWGSAQGPWRPSGWRGTAAALCWSGCSPASCC